VNEASWNTSITIAYGYPSELVWEGLQSHFTCGDLGVAMEEVDLCSQHVREACSPFVDVVMTAAAAEQFGPPCPAGHLERPRHGCNGVRLGASPPALIPPMPWAMTTAGWGPLPSGW
jgi:hypothetical protein